MMGKWDVMYINTNKLKIGQSSVPVHLPVQEQITKKYLRRKKHCTCMPHGSAPRSASPGCGARLFLLQRCSQAFPFSPHPSPKTTELPRAKFLELWKAILFSFPIEAQCFCSIL
jgi:hypothetical protein